MNKSIRYKDIIRKNYREHTLQRKVKVKKNVKSVIPSKLKIKKCRPLQFETPEENITER